MTDLSLPIINMLAEHQQLTERAIRLYNIIVDKNCAQYMPTESLIIIQELRNIAITGNPQGIHEPEELPFIDCNQEIEV